MDGNATVGGGRRLFLSYGRRDAAEFAGWLHRDLTAAGYQVFFDTHSLKAGQGWEAELERSLDAAQALVAVLSPHAVRRAGDAGNVDGMDSICLSEITRAREAMKPIFPVMVEKCDPPLSINQVQYIDFIGWRQSAERYGNQLGLLLQHIKARLERGEHAGPVDFGDMSAWFEALITEKTRHFHGRAWLFDEIERWRATTAEPALLIVGDPGLGKSTFMAELVRRGRNDRALAWHFCQAETPATIEAGRFVRSIVTQLARRLPAYAALLEAPDVMALLRPGACDADPASALEAALVDRLAAMPPPEAHHYVLIDGLDEAIVPAARSPTICDLLAPRLDRLPPWLRLIATSRRDAAVIERLGGPRMRRLDARDAHNLDDLRGFISQRLESGPLATEVARQGAAVGNVAAALQRQSDGSFLYARQALEAIAREQLDLDDLEALPLGLGGLYARFFTRSWPNETSYAPVRRVLEVILTARQPLGEDQIATIAALQGGRQLRTVMDSLTGYIARTDEGVSLYHKSLADWLVDRAVCDGRYAIDRTAGTGRLLAWCRRWRELDDRYPLLHLPAHLAEAGHIDELKALLGAAGSAGFQPALARLKRQPMSRQDAGGPRHPGVESAADFAKLKLERLNDPFQAAADFGLLATALLAAGRDAELPPLLASDDATRRDAVVSALEHAGVAKARLADIARRTDRHARPSRWRPGGAGSGAAALNGRLAALRLATAAGLDDLAVDAAADPDPAVRLLAVPYLYRLWHDHREHGWRAIDQLRERVVGTAGLPRGDALDGFGGVSLAILSRHFEDAEAMQWLRSQWRILVRDFLQSPMMRVIGRGWVVSMLTRGLELLMARQPDYQPFNLKEIAAMYRRPPEARQPAIAVIDHLEWPERGWRGIVDVLRRTDLPFDVHLMLAAERALVFHAAGDPGGVLDALEEIHRDGCAWFRQSVLYAGFHLLKRAANVEPGWVDRYLAMSRETIDSTRATLVTDAGRYQLIPHMAWAEVVAARHRPGVAPQCLPRFFGDALRLGDWDYARRTIAAAQVLSYAYRQDRVALETLRPVVAADHPALRDTLIEVLANIRFNAQAMVDDFLAEHQRGDLARRAAATAVTVKAADFPTFMDEFFNQLLVDSDDFRRDVVVAFRQAAAMHSAPQLLRWVLLWVMGLIADGPPRR